MSSTGRSDVREVDDFYRTPTWCVDALLEHLYVPKGSLILDPCCGDGAILQAVQTHGFTAVGYELHAGRLQASQQICEARQRDAIHDSTPWEARRFGALITNPPYSDAAPFVERALHEGFAKGASAVAMLLRLGFAASAKRAALHDAHPSRMYVLSSRPSFARSLKCVKPKKKCGWGVLISAIGPIPHAACPKCGDKVKVASATDSADYAWFVWSELNDDRRWRVIARPSQAAPPKRRKAA